MRRRFGFGITGPADMTLGKHMAFSTIGTLLVAGVLLLAMALAGEAERGWVLLGPVLGAPVGVLLGHLIRDSRRRGRVPYPEPRSGKGRPGGPGSGGGAH